MFNSADGFSSSGSGQPAALLNLRGNCVVWFLLKGSAEKWLGYNFALLTGSKYFESLLLIWIIYRLLNACLLFFGLFLSLYLARSFFFPRVPVLCKCRFLPSLGRPEGLTSQFCANAGVLHSAARRNLFFCFNPVQKWIQILASAGLGRVNSSVSGRPVYRYRLCKVSGAAATPWEVCLSQKPSKSFTSGPFVNRLRFKDVALGY